MAPEDRKSGMNIPNSLSSFVSMTRSQQTLIRRPGETVTIDEPFSERYVDPETGHDVTVVGIQRTTIEIPGSSILIGGGENGRIRVPYWARVRKNFEETNGGIGKALLAVLRLGSTGTTAKTMGTFTPLQYIQAKGWGGMPSPGLGGGAYGAPQAWTGLEGGILAGYTWAANALLVTASFEVGVGIGSMINAAFTPEYNEVPATD
jgi:hypothetical protein